MLITRRQLIVVLVLVAFLGLNLRGVRADGSVARDVGTLASKGSTPPQPLNDAEYQRIVQKIAEAIEAMKQAQERIARGDESSVEKQRDAERKLIEARNKVEELLRQLREQEKERMLADLINRCTRMLEEQQKVYGETKSLDRDLQSAVDALSRNTVSQKSSDQAGIEQGIVKECDKVITVLESEGSTVAFPEAFRQLRNDMQNVVARLKISDVGGLTQNIEEDIVQTLKDMIADLQRARTPTPGGGSPPVDNDPNKPKLLNEIAELKRLRSMQVRINNRTKIYHEVYREQEQLTPEKAGDPQEKAKLEQIQKELQQLAAGEAILQKLTKDMAEGRNKP
jgi:hypothetical protein